MTDSFTSLYRATHGFPPFPWQERLAEREELPRLIDIPTGCGKTSVLDVLAWRSLARGEARRVVWVVDRRLVVDDVFEHAQAVADQYGIRAIKWRGGLTLDESWLLKPHERTLIVSTVDQVGSRLLFRGYGVPWKTRSVFAGLLALDTVIVLDEVHLSRHFARTLEQVAQLAPPPQESDLEGALPPPLRVIQMSATPGASAVGTPGSDPPDPPFALEDADLENPVLEQRLRTRKRARLVKAEGSEFRRVVVAAARELAEGEAVSVVGVVVNRVQDARAIFEELRRHDDALLLTGRIRPYDRDVLLKSPELARARPGSPRGEDRPCLFVVATQTVEVGVDLDFDALVTEAATITALRQRFGRLDRLGRLGESEAVIVLRPGSESDDPIYGDDLGSTWRWLWKQAVRKGRNRVIDLGLGAEHAWPEERGPAEADSSALGASLSEREAEILAETHPYLEHDLDLHALLHGPQNDARRVSLVWRRELNEAPAEFWADLVDLCPPARAEALALPPWIAREWLEARGLQALRWRPGEPSQLVRPASFGTRGEVRHEDILVIPSRHRGNDAFGWNPDLPSRSPDEPEDQDVGDRPDFRSSEAFQGLERIAEEPQDDELQRRFTPYPMDWGVDGGIVDHRSLDDRSSQRESLRSHSAKAKAEGARMLAEVGRGPDRKLARDTLLALELHDLGKADRRFQTMLHDGDEIEAVRAVANGDLLAKSSTDWWNFAARNRAWQASGLPRGWRHEVESVLLADLGAASDPDLVRHLILAHHGRGRPWLPDAGQGVSLVGQANRFWRLHRRVGPWALGYLEALVVVADRRASEDPREDAEAPSLRLTEDGSCEAPHLDQPVVEMAFAGNTFLGFMAALGTLRLLETRSVGLSWSRGRARLHGLDREAITDAVEAALGETQFASERTTRSDGTRLPWDLCGGGRAQLHNTLPVCREELAADRERLERTLFGPWTWQDRGDSLGWVPAMRDHALRARAPTKDQPFRENGALWLAWEGIEVYGRRPGGEEALGWHRGRREPWALAWPLWSEPATLDTVRSLLRSSPRRTGDLGATEWWTTSKVKAGGKARELTAPRPIPVLELVRRRRPANPK